MNLYRYDVEIPGKGALNLMVDDYNEAQTVAMEKCGQLIEHTYTFYDSELYEDYSDKTIEMDEDVPEVKSGEILRWDVEHPSGESLDIMTSDLAVARKIASHLKAYVIRVSFRWDDSELVEDYSSIEEDE